MTSTDIGYDMLNPLSSTRLTRGFLGVTLAFAFWCLSGCGPSTLSLYPEFPARKASIQNSMMVSDYVILNATMGDTTIVDIAGNKTIAVALMDEMSGQLNDKEYHVGNRLLSSMGLLLNPGKTARVIHTLEEKDLDEERLPLRRPPFWLYRVFEKDTTLLGLLASFYSTLINATKLEGQANPVIGEAIPLGKTLGGGTWFVLLTAGYNIPVGRELGLEPPSRSMSIEQIGMYRDTHVTMLLFVVDMESGELLWADQIHEWGGTVHRDRIMRIAGKIVSSLP